MPTLPSFSTSEAPRDTLRRALVYLSEAVPEVQLVRSRNVLRRARGTTRLELRFQPSPWSRRGAGVWCSMNATVYDVALATWRAEHPDLALRQGDLLTTFGRRGSDIQLYGPLDRHRALGDVPAFVVEEVLPMLDWFESPTRLVAGIAAQERNNSLIRLVEWAVSRGEPDVARELLRQSFADVPAMRERAERERRTGLITPGVNPAEALGPTITRLCGIGVDEPLP
jgi:hypothetical protein